MATKSTAPIGDDAVKAKTGRDWKEWVKTLDAAGAASLSHAEIARLLAGQFGVPSWWSQMVTVGYERLKGRRERLQQAEGFTANASRTIAASLEAVFAAAASPRRGARWLPEGVTIHKATAPKSMRGTDAKGRKTISVLFYAKGEDKVQVSAEQEKLASQAEALRLKKTWAEALLALESLAVQPPHAGKPRASRKPARRRPSRK